MPNKSLCAALAVAIACVLTGCNTVMPPVVQAGIGVPANEVGKPVGPCAPFPKSADQSDTDRPDTRVYAVAKITDEKSPIRCDVSSHVLAVHDFGHFRNIYGDETKLKNQAAIDPIMAMIKAEAAKRPYGDHVPLRLLIFVHGGLVPHKSAVLDAESDAPGMMTDGFVPVFLVWDSDMITAYGDRLCCVDGGRPSHDHAFYLAPMPLFRDISVSGAETALTLHRQFDRWTNGLSKKNNPYDLSFTDSASICDFADDRAPDDPSIVACKKSIIYPKLESHPEYLNRDPQGLDTRVQYALLMPPRLVGTYLLPGAGAQAWDNMVRRARLAADYAPTMVVPPDDKNPEFCSQQTKNGGSAAEHRNTSSADKRFDPLQGAASQHSLKDWIAKSRPST